jgi:hypothetical protein
MLANLAVTQGAAAAADIEQLARAGDTSGIASTLARFNEEMARLLPCVDAYLAGVNQ